MPLKEYENLTEYELKWADHYAEIGDMGALQKYRELSASRAVKPIGTSEETKYNEQVQIHRTDC